MKKTFRNEHYQSRTSDLSQSIYRPKNTKSGHSAVVTQQQFSSMLEIPISRLRSEDLERSREVNDQLENSNVILMKEVLKLKKESVRLEKILRRFKHKKTCKFRDVAARSSSDVSTLSVSGSMPSSSIVAAGKTPTPTSDLRVSLNATGMDDIDCVDFIKREPLDLVDYGGKSVVNVAHSSNYVSTFALDSGWSRITDSGTIKNSRYEYKKNLYPTSRIVYNKYELNEADQNARQEKSRTLMHSVKLEPRDESSDQTFQESKYSKNQVLEHKKNQVILNDVSMGQWHKPFLDQKSKNMPPESSQQDRTSLRKDENLNLAMTERSMSATSSIASPDFLSPVSPTLQSPNTPESPTSFLTTKTLETFELGGVSIISEENSQSAETMVENEGVSLFFDSEDNSLLEFDSMNAFKLKEYHQITSNNKDKDVLISQGVRERGETLENYKHLPVYIPQGTGKTRKNRNLNVNDADYEERLERAVEYVEIEKIKDVLLQTSPSTPSLDHMAFECEEFDSDGKRVQKEVDGGGESGGGNGQGIGHQEDLTDPTMQGNEGGEHSIDDITHGVSKLACASDAHGSCDRAKS